MRLLLPLIALLLAGCANLSMNDVYRNPTFKYDSTSISGVNFSELSGASKITVRNSNPYNLPISAMSAQLWLEGKPWLDLDNDAISGLPANGQVSVNLQWSLVFDSLLQRAASVYERGEADFTLKMSPTVNVPVLGPQTLQWTANFSIPIPKVPTAKLVDWKLSSVSFSKISLLLDVEVNNPNVFAIATSGWSMDVNNHGKALADVALKDSTIRARGASTQQVEVTLSIVDVGLAMVNGFKSGAWPSSLQLDWSGLWQSPDLDFDLPDLKGSLTL